MANGTCSSTGTTTSSAVTRANAPSTGRHQPGRPAVWIRWYGRPSRGSATRGCAAAGGSTDVIAAAPTSGQRALEAAQAAVAAEQLEGLEQGRRDPATGHGHPDRTERVPRLEAELVDEPGLERLLDRGGGPLRQPGQRVVRRLHDAAAVLVEQLGD